MSDYRHDIEKYLKGELTPAERNALERKALHDPFLADALEGAEQIEAQDFSSDVASLNNRIIATKSVSTWIWPARIAASLGLLAVTSFIVWMLLQPEGDQDLAFEKTSPAPITNSDSVAPSAGEVSTPPVDQPKPLSSSGPTTRNKDLATRSTVPSKTEKPAQPVMEPDVLKNEPVGGVAAAQEESAKVAETRADEIAVTESLALDKAAEKETERAKKAIVEDDVTDKKLAQRSAKRKDTAKEAVSGYKSDANTSPLTYSFKSTVVSGRVTSTEDGSPLPGVNVAVKGTSQGTSTDANGYYSIEANDGKAMVYSYIGFESKEIDIGTQQNINVQLSLDLGQLNEVVVTAGGLAERRENAIEPSTFELTHPQSGMSSFKAYLERNVRYPQTARSNKIEGRVTIQFTIETDGRLTNFTIIKGIGSGCDEELIRLIKEGPSWVPTMREGKPLRDTAKVRFNFELPK